MKKTRLRLFAATLSLLVAACRAGDSRPEGEVAILDSWEEEGAVAAIAYRVSSVGTLAIGRWGLTLRVDSNRRRYWDSFVGEESLSPGSSLTGVIRLGFASGEERMTEGSAAVDAAWFE